MGKQKRKHNWKARQQVETTVDRTEEKKIKVDLKDLKEDEAAVHDECNALVLPAKKRKTKVKVPSEPKQKLLTKKQRKTLEKIVERREKKKKRAGLLEALQTVQATKAEAELLTSTTEVYSGKIKRKLVIEQLPSGLVKVNALSGSNKKQHKVGPVKEKEEAESSSSSEESDEDSDYDSDEDSVPNISKDMEDQETVTDSEEKVDSVSSLSHEGKSMDIVAKDISKGDISKVSTKPVTARLEGKPVVNVPVSRSDEVQEGRLKLPILGEEQVVVEAINDNPVVVICGETGSGKTTQVPQFLYEAGYAHGPGIIAVTEPRRVAAISMSKRIAYEMNLTSRQVSYQIRYEGNITEETKIKFMTDGVLLKEVQKDFLLSKYSVVVIDEAHERSVYTDILIGLLSRIVPLRHKKGNPLKLVIMSATLRVEDFTENKRLFPVTPPVVKVASRQFPVTIHFNKRTPVNNYMGEAYKKVCKIHRMLPDGGILIFVTGQMEVHSLCAKLRRTFPFHKHNILTGKSRKTSESEDTDKVPLPKVNLDDFSVLPMDEEAEIGDEEAENDGELSDDLGGEDSDNDDTKLTRASAPETPLYVLPLYSLLSGDRQTKVFEPPPEGSRLCVVATNVAETSLTIPNIKYIVDTGKVKTKFYDKVTGVSAFKVTWTSQASANQRAGRAGRTGPGHTYRLYSSAVFNDDFEKFTPAEITRRPVDDLVLLMKDMSIDKVINFPFPTPPDAEALRAAEKLLVSLGALEVPPPSRSFKEAKKAMADPSSRITPLGRAMACFPVAPRYGKMLSLGHQHNLLPYVVAIVAALSVQEIFQEIEQPAINDQQKEELKRQRGKSVAIKKTWAGSGHSLLLGDLMVLLKAVGACEYSGCSPSFCGQHEIRYKAMLEVRKLRAQLTNSVNAIIPEANLVLDPKMQPPNDLQAKLLRQIVLAGLADHVARKMPVPPVATDESKKLKFAYQCISLEDPVFIHPSSVLYKLNMEYIIYQHIDETSKLYMKGVTSVEPEWLPLFAPSHCRFSKPLDTPPPRYDQHKGTIVGHVTSTFGPHFWTLPTVEVDFPDELDKYKWFGKSLLEGAVCPKLKSFVPVLLTAPATMVKTWAKLQPRTETMLKALIAEKVNSLSSLTEAWTRNPKCLLSAYREWVPEARHDELTAVWPPQ